MNRPTLIFALLALVAFPAVALAGTIDETVSDPLSWACAWSVWRWLLLLAVSLTAWLFGFHWWFPNRLTGKPNQPAPWPLDAFGSTAAAIIMTIALGFVIIFAVVSDELTRRPIQVVPGGNSFINRNFLWAAVLVLGASLAMIVRFFVFRHKRS